MQRSWCVLDDWKLKVKWANVNKLVLHKSGPCMCYLRVSYMAQYQNKCGIGFSFGHFVWFCCYFKVWSGGDGGWINWSGRNLKRSPCKKRLLSFFSYQSSYHSFWPFISSTETSFYYSLLSPVISGLSSGCIPSFCLSNRQPYFRHSKN